jgi:nucleotide-binding universal stress UspA family protein
MFKHILLPTDGSAVSNKAVKAGLKFAKEAGAHVTGYYAVEAVQSRIYGEGYMIPRRSMADVDEWSKQYGEQQLAAMAALAEKAGVAFDTLCTKADTPYQGILDAVRKKKCDLIYMASHGRHGLAGIVMGSVTQKVLSRATVPVLVHR